MITTGQAARRFCPPSFRKNSFLSIMSYVCTYVRSELLKRLYRLDRGAETSKNEPADPEHAHAADRICHFPAGPPVDRTEEERTQRSPQLTYEGEQREAC